MENDRRVGYWLGILWSKARLSLKRAGMDAPQEYRGGWPWLRATRATRRQTNPP